MNAMMIAAIHFFLLFAGADEGMGDEASGTVLLMDPPGNVWSQIGCGRRSP
jgi:hypothetical protein